MATATQSHAVTPLGTKFVADVFHDRGADMKKIAQRIAVTLGAAAVTTALVATPAQADELQIWNRYKNGHKLSQTTYNDSRNALCAMDLEKDGHSEVVVWHYKGSKTKHKIWVHGGYARMVCGHFKHENKGVYFKSCYGEWAKQAKDRLIYSCGSTHGFHT